MFRVLDAILTLYIWLIFIRVVLGWVGAGSREPLFRPVFVLTDPVLKPLSGLVPPIGGVLDISPMIALLIIWMLRSFVARAL